MSEVVNATPPRPPHLHLSFVLTFWRKFLVSQLSGGWVVGVGRYCFVGRWAACCDRGVLALFYRRPTTVVVATVTKFSLPKMFFVSHACVTLEPCRCSLLSEGHWVMFPIERDPYRVVDVGSRWSRVRPRMKYSSVNLGSPFQFEWWYTDPIF